MTDLTTHTPPVLDVDPDHTQQDAASAQHSPKHATTAIRSAILPRSAIVKVLTSYSHNQIQRGHSQLSQLISHYYLVSTMTDSPIQHRQSLSKSALPMAQTLWRSFPTLGLIYQQLALRPCATSTNTLTTCYHPALFLELPMALKCTLLDDFLSCLILKTGPIRQTCTSSRESMTSSCHGKPAKHLGFCHHVTHNHHPRHNSASKLYHHTPTQPP